VGANFAFLPLRFPNKGLKKLSRAADFDVKGIFIW
jgi:hypothetical protein